VYNNFYGNTMADKSFDSIVTVDNQRFHSFIHSYSFNEQ